MHLLAVGGITVEEGVRIKPLFIHIDSYYLFLYHMELEEEEEEEPKPKSYIMCTFIRLVHGYGLFFHSMVFSTNKLHLHVPISKASSRSSQNFALLLL